MEATSRKCFMFRLIAVMAVISVATSKEVGKKPASSYFTICPRGDSKALEECVTKNMIELKSQLKKGIPAIGFIPLEPLTIPKVELNEGGSFVLDTTLTNVILRGVGDFAVRSVKMKLDDKGLIGNISMTIPDLRIAGGYQMDGRILVIPISGKGNVELNTTNLITEFNFVSKAVERSGKSFLEIVDVKCNIIRNGTSSVWFYNLFNGDKLLGNATNNFLNDNAEETHEVTKHLPEGVFATIFKEVVSKIFDLYSIDELFAK